MSSGLLVGELRRRAVTGRRGEANCLFRLRSARKQIVVGKLSEP